MVAFIVQSLIVVALFALIVTLIVVRNRRAR
jgi:hypothetical protein